MVVSTRPWVVVSRNRNFLGGYRLDETTLSTFTEVKIISFVSAWTKVLILS